MLEVGSLVDGKYKILSEVGHGGMSVVYMAINEKANKTWAIKEVRREGVLDFEAVVQGLVVETDMLKRLNHPNLPSIIDVIEDSESMLIVMDYIEGRSLSKVLSEHGAQPQELVIEWAKQLCDVLYYLHTREPAIIYRDMKPSNVMLKPDGNVTLIDFGTAREYKGGKNIADTTCLGTIGYAAPEQFGGMGETDARTDIYCLGATLYHLVTGMNPSEPPYEIQPIRQINPYLSSGLERIINKCTQKDPNLRYQDCMELMYDLEHYQDLDVEVEKSNKHKLTGFITTAAFMFVFLIAGFVLNAVATGMEKDTYEEYIKAATSATDDATAIENYKSAIQVTGMGGETEAYLALIELFKSDSQFDKTEEAELLKVMAMDEVDQLEENVEGYVDVCYEIGRLYFNFYLGNADSLTTADFSEKAKSSTKWFNYVIQYGEEINYENLNTARIYYQIGYFYSNIDAWTSSGDDADNDVYLDFFEQLENLMATVDDGNSTSSKVELCSMIASSLYQYIENFASYSNEITGERVVNLFSAVYDKLVELSDMATVNGNMKIKVDNSLELTMKLAYQIIKVQYGSDLPWPDEVDAAYGGSSASAEEESDVND